jgi:DHA3 family macrolide efflux protein-like MFS transporter
MENSKKLADWKQTFFPFWVSQLVSLLGSALVMFTLVWWLTEKTGSATVLATATMAGMIPEIVIQPFAGAIVDRINRKRVIIIADGVIAVATLVLGVLFYLDLAEVWAIYGLMLIRAVGGAFHYPAGQASVALMVPREQLARLGGLTQAARGIINIVSAPLGALILTYMDVEGAMLIDVVSAAIAIAIVAMTHIPRQEKLASNGGNWFSTVMQDMKDGLRYVMQWKAMVLLVAIALVFKAALSPAFSLIPLLVYEYLQGNAAQYSLVEVVGGVGIILGGLLLGVWGGFKQQVWTIFLGLFGVGAGIFLMGLLPAGGFIWMLPLMFVVGFTVPLVDGPFGAIMQSAVDNAYQGRVMTLLGSILNLSGPIGLAMAGPVSDRFGLQVWYLTAGLLIFACLMFGLFNKTVMRVEEGPGRRQTAEDRETE